MRLSESRQIDIKLLRYLCRPLPGNIDVEVEPNVSATVMIDQVVVGAAPGVIENIPAGNHELLVDAPLYRSAITSVIVQGREQTENIKIKLDPAWANVKVSSGKVIANVIVDGQRLGQTPH